jgi:hypothetical protein
MKPTIELLSLDSSFVWQAPLSVSQFLEACKHRGMHLNDWFELEAFHRSRILLPWFRFETKDASIPVKESDFSEYLDGYAGFGTPCDPRQETFNSWSEYIQQHKYGQNWSSRFFYSRYQLLLIPDLRSIRKYMQSQKTEEKVYSRKGIFHLEIPEEKQSEGIEDAVKNDELAFLLTAIETKYLPIIYNTLTLHRRGTTESWFQTGDHIDPAELLTWVNWKPKQIKESARHLISRADLIDPLREWVDLIRMCHSEKWEMLRNDALIAMDHRIAAEILLRFYEDLAKSGLAEPLEPSPKNIRGEYNGRLKSDDKDIEPILMEFGISPHPALVLVLEGETEELLVPRVMELLDIPRKADFIQLYKGGGVDQRYNLLASYISTPKLGEAMTGGRILTRPPTRFLIAFDPESSFATPEGCEAKRMACVTKIIEAIPKEYRTGKLCKDIDSLVEIKTWNKGLESFEFAHFTNSELAQAMGNICPGLDVIELEKRIGNLRVGDKNKKPGNLEYLWKGWKTKYGCDISKIRLAEALWSLLKQKIEDSISTGTAEEIPITRVLIHAVNVANALPRRRVMIST